MLFDDEKDIESMNWSEWRPWIIDGDILNLTAPIGPGVYEFRNTKTGRPVMFGQGDSCIQAITKLLPAAVGDRYQHKKEYLLTNGSDLEYRTVATSTRLEAKRARRALRHSRKDWVFS